MSGAPRDGRTREAAADIAAVVGRPYHGSRRRSATSSTSTTTESASTRSRPQVTPALRRPEGRLLLRLPAHPAAQGHPGRGPRVPHAHGRRRRDAWLRRRCEWNYKTDCCGASLALCEQDVVIDLTRRILRDARDCGAEAVAVACPLCQVNLDTRQADIAKKYGGWQHIPVIYLSQLVGRAIGVDDARARPQEAHGRRHGRDGVGADGSHARRCRSRRRPPRGARVYRMRRPRGRRRVPLWPVASRASCTQACLDDLGAPFCESSMRSGHRQGRRSPWRAPTAGTTASFPYTPADG